MKLKDLIDSHKWRSIKAEIKNIYPDQEKNLPGFKAVFKKLKKMKPAYSNDTIIIKYYHDEQDPAMSHMDVSAQAEDGDDGLQPRYALDFVRWKKWLGMNLHADTLKNFTAPEVICYCLYEMTFDGYNEKDIQKKWLRLKKRFKKKKNTGKKLSTIIDKTR